MESKPENQDQHDYCAKIKMIQQFNCVVVVVMLILLCCGIVNCVDCVVVIGTTIINCEHDCVVVVL